MISLETPIRSEQDWDTARAQMVIDPQAINLNAGTLSPLPRVVMQRATELRQRMSENPTSFLAREMPPLLESARAALANYLNVPTHELLLMENPTMAANTLIDSLEIPPGMTVITTDHEYGSIRLKLDRRARRDGLDVETIKLPYRSESPDEFVACFEEAITGRTAALLFSHIAASTGLCLPADKICAMARERGVMTVIDGSHAPGAVALDLQKVGADIYFGSCHKWMMAPNGAAFAHVREEHKREISPLIISWGTEFDEFKPDVDSGWGGTFWQRAFEFHGTTDRCAQLTLPEVLAFRETLGGEAVIRQRMRQLSDYAREKLSDEGLLPATPIYSSAGNLTAFAFDGVDPLVWRSWLWETHRIECPITPGGGKHFLRVSTAWFNTIEQISALVEALRDWKHFPPV